MFARPILRTAVVHVGLFCSHPRHTDDAVRGRWRGSKLATRRASARRTRPERSGRNVRQREARRKAARRLGAGRKRTRRRRTRASRCVCDTADDGAGGMRDAGMLGGIRAKWVALPDPGCVYQGFLPDSDVGRHIRHTCTGKHWRMKCSQGRGGGERGRPSWRRPRRGTSRAAAAAACAAPHVGVGVCIYSTEGGLNVAGLRLARRRRQLELQSIEELLPNIDGRAREAAGGRGQPGLLRAHHGRCCQARQRRGDCFALGASTHVR